MTLADPTTVRSAGTGAAACVRHVHQRPVIRDCPLLFGSTNATTRDYTRLHATTRDYTRLLYIHTYIHTYIYMSWRVVVYRGTRGRGRELDTSIFSRSLGLAVCSSRQIVAPSDRRKLLAREKKRERKITTTITTTTTTTTTGFVGEINFRRFAERRRRGRWRPCDSGSNCFVFRANVLCGIYMAVLTFFEKLLEAIWV